MSGLKLEEHTFHENEQVAEIWHDGEFIGTVFALEGRGVKIITKHDVSVDVDKKYAPVVATGQLSVVTIDIGMP